MKKARVVVDVAYPGDVNFHHFVDWGLTEHLYQALFFLRESVPVYVLELVLAMFLHNSTQRRLQTRMSKERFLVTLNLTAGST